MKPLVASLLALPLVVLVLVLALVFGPLAALLVGIEHPPDPLNIGWDRISGGGN